MNLAGLLLGLYRVYVNGVAVNPGVTPTGASVRTAINFIGEGLEGTDHPTTQVVDIDLSALVAAVPDEDPDLNERLPVLCACVGALAFTGTGTGTLTASESVALSSSDFDGIAPTAAERVLLPTGSVTESGGAEDAWIYVVTSAGEDGVSPWVLTRAADSNASNECQRGAWCVAENGDTLLGHQFQIANTGAVVLNTTELVIDDMGIPGDEGYVGLPRYTAAQLLNGTPSALIAGRLVWCTDDATGAQVACSGGASVGDWRRGINASNDLVSAGA